MLSENIMLLLHRTDDKIKCHSWFLQYGPRTFIKKGFALLHFLLYTLYSKKKEKKRSTSSESNYLAWLDSNENFLFKGTRQLGATYTRLLRGSFTVVLPGDDCAVLESITIRRWYGSLCLCFKSLNHWKAANCGLRYMYALQTPDFPLFSGNL